MFLSTHQAHHPQCHQIAPVSGPWLAFHCWNLTFIYNYLYESTFYIPFMGSGPQGLWDVSRCNRSSICQIGQPPETRDLKKYQFPCWKNHGKVKLCARTVDSAFNKDGLDMAWHITCIHPSRHDHTHGILQARFWIFWENWSSTSICSDGSPPSGPCWLCLKRFNDWKLSEEVQSSASLSNGLSTAGPCVPLPSLSCIDSQKRIVALAMISNSCLGRKVPSVLGCLNTSQQLTSGMM